MSKHAAAPHLAPQSRRALSDPTAALRAGPPCPGRSPPTAPAAPKGGGRM